MTQLQAIKAEVERLRKVDRAAFEKEHISFDTFHGRNQVENHLLSFIESLEKEQDVDLDKEINEVWEHDKVLNPESYDKGYELQLDKINLTNLAHHFYNLGKDHFRDVTKMVGLDEAAEEYGLKEAHGENNYVAWYHKYGFKAGAEWMAGQGETVEGEIMCAVAYPHENKVVARVYGDYKFGDKVIVQIRKKDG